MDNIEMICNVDSLPLFGRYSDFVKIEDEYGVSIDYWLVDHLKVQFIYKYKDYCVYQIDKCTIILDKDGDDYSHDELLFLADHFKFGNDFNVKIHWWNCEECCFKMHKIKGNSK